MCDFQDIDVLNVRLDKIFKHLWRLTMLYDILILLKSIRNQSYYDACLIADMQDARESNKNECWEDNHYFKFDPPE